MAALLDEVKTRLSVTEKELDSILQGYIDDVVAFCVSAGVPEATIEKEYGLVARGVSDLWQGESHFSDIFKMRLVQVQKRTPEVKA